MLSATYRQSSKFRTDLISRDPENRLFARGPRFRLTAELIRDNALAVSGQLSTKMFGPPVYPPQPEGVWRVTGLVDNTYRVSAGEDALRRGVYTVWRRSAPYPSFMNFDAPDRLGLHRQAAAQQHAAAGPDAAKRPGLCRDGRGPGRSITLTGPAGQLDDQLTTAFRTVVTRRPTSTELSTLKMTL